MDTYANWLFLLSINYVVVFFDNFHCLCNLFVGGIFDIFLRSCHLICRRHIWHIFALYNNPKYNSKYTYSLLRKHITIILQFNNITNKPHTSRRCRWCGRSWGCTIRPWHRSECCWWLHLLAIEYWQAWPVFFTSRPCPSCGASPWRIVFLVSPLCGGGFLCALLLARRLWIMLLLPVLQVDLCMG